MLPDLPVTDALPALGDALARGSNAVLVAPPGAGKTTLVPLALLTAPWRGDGKILMLEPRRVAARAAARRMAALLDEAVGQRIGFRTRLDAAVSAATRIEVITEGLLVRRLQSDPGLDGVAAVLFDEVHERALDADLALAFCLDLQRNLRPELRLLAMSATLDGARLSTLLDASVIESAGRMFPVEIRHAARDLADPRDLPVAMAAAIRAVLARDAGDVLAFLPGMAEIRRTEALLANAPALVLPLHGDLPVEAQDRALNQADQRRVVLATSIAETSLTVPGVRIVVDGGFRRTPRLDASSGLSRLVTARISRAAAEQRAGRAGREAPGVAVRLWTEALHRGLAPFDKPEILDSELSGLRLDCASWGALPGDLSFPDAPPAGALAAAEALLRDLGALDNDNRITAAGRAMARIGAHPRLAALMLEAEHDASKALAADIAALLEERDPLRDAGSADIALRLEAIAGRGGDPGTIARIRRTAQQYRRRLQTGEARAAGNTAQLTARLIAAAFPDRIAQNRDGRGAFRLSGGGGANLGEADPLAREKFLAVAALDLRKSPRIAMAAPIALDDLTDVLAHRITETVETSVDPSNGSVLRRRRLRLGALVLSDKTEAGDPADIAAALAASVTLADLPWTDSARQFQARVAFMRALDPAYPDLSDTALQATLADWIAPYLAGMKNRAGLAKLDLHTILRSMLDYEQARALDRALPTHLDLPGGRAAIDYTHPVPLAAARAQMFYGMTATPKLAGGRIPLRLALLSPARRPIAVTADLAAFWQTGWSDARKDMRGRYPKHDWPENPAIVPPPDKRPSKCNMNKR